MRNRENLFALTRYRGTRLVRRSLLTVCNSSEEKTGGLERPKRQALDNRISSSLPTRRFRKIDRRNVLKSSASCWLIVV